MSGAAMAQLLTLCRAGGGLEGAMKIMNDKAALDAAPLPDLASIADEDLPGCV